MEVKRPDSFSSLNSLTPSLNISETKIKSLDEYEKNFNEVFFKFYYFSWLIIRLKKIYIKTWPSLPDDIVLPSTSIEDVFGSIDDVKKVKFYSNISALLLFLTLFLTHNKDAGFRIVW